MTQYRNSVSEAGCQSPTSPHSAPSYSPAQSPVLPPAANLSSSPFAEAYYLQQQQQQQQQQTSALQHQFEQFNMVSVVLGWVDGECGDWGGLMVSCPAGGDWGGLIVGG